MPSPLDELKKVLIPPDDPVVTGTPEQWNELVSRLNMRLPDDYKSFLATYGHGSPDGYLWVINPFVHYLGYLDLESSRSWHREVFRDTYSRDDYLLESLGLDSPVPAGLVPWATSDGGTGFWDTRPGDPQRWTIVEVRDDSWKTFPGTMTEFLVACITGTHKSVAYGPFQPPPPIYFRRYNGPL